MTGTASTKTSVVLALYTGSQELGFGRQGEAEGQQLCSLDISRGAPQAKELLHKTPQHAILMLHDRIAGWPDSVPSVRIFEPRLRELSSSKE